MSNALAIAGVSAVLRDLLNNGFIDHQVTDAMGQGVDVTAVAPDLVQTTGPDVRPRLNLFLHQITFNAAWRNVDLPSRNARGARLTNPPLAVDLHYLVTAYGTQDLQAEVLLGYAMQLLHETPVLTREAIRTALVPPTVDAAILPTIYRALRASALADQIEMLKITPATVNTDEMSRLWTAVQTHYRPSMPYLVTVVLIESELGASSALPVLTRGPRDLATGVERGIVAQTDLSSPYPDITRIEAPNQQTAARLGESVDVHGSRLDGANRSVVLTHPRFGFTRTIAAAPGNAADRIRFVVPNDPVQYPAGTYLLTVSVQRPGETQPREAGPLLLRLAPRITTALPFNVARDAQGTASITLGVAPELRPDQRVSLLLGTRDVPAHINAQTGSATFAVTDATPGTFYVRLRVDGVESILVDRTQTPPRFFNHQITVT